MRRSRDAPEIFGMSLVDLLVGALSLVALLWVLNVRNTEFRFSSDAKATAFASIDQFGITHFSDLVVELPTLGCSLDIVNDSSLGTRIRTKIGLACPDVSACSGQLECSQSDQSLIFTFNDNDESQLSVRLVQLEKGFQNGVHLTLDDFPTPVVAHLTIKACREGTEPPHYVRARTISASGIDVTSFIWQDEAYYQGALSKIAAGYSFSDELIQESVSGRLRFALWPSGGSQWESQLLVRFDDSGAFVEAPDIDATKENEAEDAFTNHLGVGAP